MDTRSLTIGLLLGSTLASVAFCAKPVGAAPDAGLRRATFDAVVDTVLDRYVEPVDRSALLGRALKHMVAGLDPYSYYLTADERRSLRARLKGGRSGLTLFMRGATPETRTVEVLGVVPDSPAAAAGVSVGDKVLRIEGRDVKFFLSQAEAEAQLSGDVGDRVVLSVQSPQAPGPRDVALVLTAGATTGVQARLTTTPRGPVAVLRIDSFRTGTGARVRDELARLRRAAGTLTGVVLDLRGNPGGELDEALVVLELFVAQGVLTRTRGRGGRILREERAHAPGSDTTTPVVVLQDRHTASAAELVAAALRSHGRARLVGERSFGKGSVQEVIGLEDGSLLTLSIARYFSPDDEVIDKVGVVPHDAIALRDDDEAGWLNAAMQALAEPGAAVSG
jgi:carboxyl-terminal processing protease